MKKIASLRQALSDPRYFGGQLDGDSWLAWRALLFAILGEPLTWTSWRASPPLRSAQRRWSAPHDGTRA